MGAQFSPLAVHLSHTRTSPRDRYWLAGAVPLAHAAAAQAETYDATLKSWGYTAPAEMAQLLRTLGVQQGEPVLDAGCGTGLSGEALAGAGFTLLSGCDVSPRSIEVLQAKVLYSELKVADLDIQEGPLPFADDSFSAAVTVGVTSYISRFELLFPELLRVVRPGGIVAFTHRGPNASITAQDDQDGLAVEDEHALGLWDSDYRGVRSAAQSLVDEGRWEEAHTSGLQPYMPRNPDPAESNKRIRYHAYRRVR